MKLPKVDWISLTSAEAPGEAVELFLSSQNIHQSLSENDSRYIKNALLNCVCWYEKFPELQAKALQLLIECHLVNRLQNYEIAPRWDIFLRNLNGWLSKATLAYSFFELFSLLKDVEVMQTRGLSLDDYQLLYYVRKAVEIHKENKRVIRSVLQLLAVLVDLCANILPYHPQGLGRDSTQLEYLSDYIVPTFLEALTNSISKNEVDHDLIYPSLSSLITITLYIPSYLSHYLGSLTNICLSAIISRSSPFVTCKSLELLKLLSTSDSNISYGEYFGLNGFYNYQLSIYLMIILHERSIVIFLDALEILNSEDYIKDVAILLEILLHILNNFDYTALVIGRIARNSPGEFLSAFNYDFHMMIQNYFYILNNFASLSSSSYQSYVSKIATMGFDSPIYYDEFVQYLYTLFNQYEELMTKYLTPEYYSELLIKMCDKCTELDNVFPPPNVVEAEILTSNSINGVSSSSNNIDQYKFVEVLNVNNKNYTENDIILLLKKIENLERENNKKNDLFSLSSLKLQNNIINIGHLLKLNNKEKEKEKGRENEREKRGFFHTSSKENLNILLNPFLNLIHLQLNNYSFLNLISYSYTSSSLPSSPSSSFFISSPGSPSSLTASSFSFFNLYRDFLSDTFIVLSSLYEACQRVHIISSIHFYDPISLNSEFIHLLEDRMNYFDYLSYQIREFYYFLINTSYSASSNIYKTLCNITELPLNKLFFELKLLGLITTTNDEEKFYYLIKSLKISKINEKIQNFPNSSLASFLNDFSLTIDLSNFTLIIFLMAKKFFGNAFSSYSVLKSLSGLLSDYLPDDLLPRISGLLTSASPIKISGTGLIHTSSNNSIQIKGNNYSTYFLKPEICLNYNEFYNLFQYFSMRNIFSLLYNLFLFIIDPTKYNHYQGILNKHAECSYISATLLNKIDKFDEEKISRRFSHVGSYQSDILDQFVTDEEVPLENLYNYLYEKLIVKEKVWNLQFLELFRVSKMSSSYLFKYNTLPIAYNHSSLSFLEFLDFFVLLSTRCSSFSSNNSSNDIIFKVKFLLVELGLCSTNILEEEEYIPELTTISEDLSILSAPSIIIEAIPLTSISNDKENTENFPVVFPEGIDFKRKTFSQKQFNSDIYSSNNELPSTLSPNTMESLKAPSLLSSSSESSEDKIDLSPTKLASSKQTLSKKASFSLRNLNFTSKDSTNINSSEVSPTLPSSASSSLSPSAAPTLPSSTSSSLSPSAAPTLLSSASSSNSSESSSAPSIPTDSLNSYNSISSTSKISSGVPSVTVPSPQIKSYSPRSLFSAPLILSSSQDDSNYSSNTSLPALKIVIPSSDNSDSSKLSPSHRLEKKNSFSSPRFDQANSENSIRRISSQKEEMELEKLKELDIENLNSDNNFSPQSSSSLSSTYSSKFSPSSPHLNSSVITEEDDGLIKDNSKRRSLKFSSLQFMSKDRKNLDSLGESLIEKETRNRNATKNSEKPNNFSRDDKGKLKFSLTRPSSLFIPKDKRLSKLDIDKLKKVSPRFTSKDNNNNANDSDGGDLDSNFILN